MGKKRKDIRSELAGRMAELRATHGKTQQQCADALGIAQNSYAELEGGRTRPRRRDLVTLAVLYGLAVDDAFPVLAEDRRAA